MRKRFRFYFREHRRLSLIALALFSGLISFASYLFLVRKGMAKEDIEAAATVASLVMGAVAIITASVVPTPRLAVQSILRPGSQFNSALSQGIEKAFAALEDVRHATSLIDEAGSLKDQHDQMLSEFRACCLSASIDAVIIRPIFSDGAFFQALQEAASYRKTVVVIDVIPSTTQISTLHSTLFRFVASDHSRGGEIVAEYLLSCAKETSNSVLILMLGPYTSQPGTMRSQAMLWHLFNAGFPEERIVPLLLSDWNRKAAVELLLNKINTQRRRMERCGAIYVFAGADAIALAINDAIASPDFIENYADIHKKIRLVGYDGIKDTKSTFALAGKAMCAATVDVEAVRQGEIAAQQVIFLARGREQGGAVTVVLQPRLADARKKK